MPMPSGDDRPSIHGHLAVAVIAILAWTLAAVAPATAARRQGDRFGLRIGAWPQRRVQGTLANIRFHSDPDTTYAATVDEPSLVLPFLEIYGLFHLGGYWWAEGSVGWSRRSDVEVGGRRLEGLPTDSLARILLGEGKVDFLPLFVGGRAVKEFGARPRPHNIYARGGLSLIFASESPSIVHPRIGRSIYNEGTKGGFGFVVGTGGEYYVADKFGLTADAQYRYAKLNYGDEANLDMSGFWLGAGFTVMTR